MNFRDRSDAGRKLAEKLKDYERQDPLVLAVPRGGVPVGCAVARALHAPFDLILVKKLPVPYNREAGFGAVTADGTVVLNRELVDYMRLEKWVIDTVVQGVQDEVQRQEQAYRTGPPLDLKGKTVIITDDGLASGYTMLAAVRDAKDRSAKRVIVAAPCAPRSSVELLEKEADAVVCLTVQESGPFAVASYYESFPDLSDGEVLSMLGACAVS